MVSTSNLRRALPCVHTGAKGALALNTTGPNGQHAFVQKTSPRLEKWTEAVESASDDATKTVSFFSSDERHPRRSKGRPHRGHRGHRWAFTLRFIIIFFSFFTATLTN